MTLADIAARISAREERINKAKDNLNCFSADCADSNRKKRSLLDKIDDLENHHRRSNLESSWYTYNWETADALEFLGRTLYSETWLFTLCLKVPWKKPGYVRLHIFTPCFLKRMKKLHICTSPFPVVRPILFYPPPLQKFSWVNLRIDENMLGCKKQTPLMEKAR